MPQSACRGTQVSAGKQDGNTSERFARMRADESDEDSREPYYFRYHQDSWDRQKGHLSTGDYMAEWFANLPIPMKKAMSIPNAKKAVNKEWDALASLPASDVSKVRPKADVIADAKRRRKTVHFGSLMDLCHEKGPNSIFLKN